MSKPTVGIVYGGRSVEHQVSIRSAENVFNNINKDLFQPILIGIDQGGDWYLTSEVSANINKGEKLDLKLSVMDPQLNSALGSKTPDIIFPVLHGTGGEDGSIQGLLEVVNLPCVGSGVLGSSISMNKLISKQLLINAGIPTARYVLIHEYDNENEICDTVEKKLSFPVIIKPVSLGSSVGVFKVENRSQFINHLKESFEYDNEILAEEFVNGRELECAILGNAPPRASLPGEIIVNSESYDFYSFDAKYVDPEAAKLVIPAELTDLQIKEIQKLSLKSYVNLQCEDYARVDLFMTGKGEVYINEINTIPGFTNSSMFPMLWKHAGIEYPDLITQLINLAIERHQKKQRLSTKFESKLDG